LGLNLQGLAETIIFAEKWRSKEDMLSIINEGAWEWYNKYQSQLHFKRLLSRSFPLKHLVKDLRLAKEAGLDSPLSIHCMIVRSSSKGAWVMKM
jgi:3-hydroxyisobutyrate dehydrogenase